MAYRQLGVVHGDNVKVPCKHGIFRSLVLVGQQAT